MADELTLVVKPASTPGNSFNLVGWLDISVRRSAERIPNEFRVGMTERYPGEMSSVVSVGDLCQVYLGEQVAKNLVLTGYIDEIARAIASRSHTISVSGRGKCQDLVDCSAEWPGGQISGSSALQVARKLAAPYGITVASDISQQRVIEQFNLNYGETPFDIIEKTCRYSALLCYERADGSLFLTQLGKTGPSVGLSQGVNIQTGNSTFSMRDRFSEYRAYAQALDTNSDVAVGTGGNLQGRQSDPGVLRRRAKFFVSESVGGSVSLELVKKRIVWEVNRRNGRSRRAVITTDTWRDKDGKLWEPNTLIDIVAPDLKIDTRTEDRWIIGDVEYARGPAGTTATITAMPQLAYLPQPKNLQPEMADAPYIHSGKPFLQSAH